ncbi:hypothetical protein TR2A62_0218 [Thalassobium sp. R2A62]|nr:hypothetical protein TR2A62_0218 [Thalassobium sp. R2A62]
MNQKSSLIQILKSVPMVLTSDILHHRNLRLDMIVFWMASV